jgi:hypothetical protein
MMVDRSVLDRMNAGIAGLMRQYPRDDTPAYGDVPPGFMLARDKDGKVVVVPANEYRPSTGARPDQKLTIGPNGEVVSSPHTSSALNKALAAAQGNAAPGSSFGEIGMADPSGGGFFTPQYTDADFARSLALRSPQGRPTTQENIDEEERLKAKLALSAREMQQENQGSWFGRNQLLDKNKIAQMYGAPSPDVPAAAKAILQQRSEASAPASVAPPAAADNVAPTRTPLPMMTRPMTAPDNIGQGSLRFGVPFTRDTEGAMSNMPVRLGSGDYMRFSMDRAAPPVQTRAAPPSRAPIDLTSGSSAAPTPQASGLLSRLFGAQSGPVSTKEMLTQAASNPDDAGAWMRAERQYAATHKADPNVDVTKLDESGMKRGGTAGGKDAAMHKALEIIHHLLMRQR